VLRQPAHRAGRADLRLDPDRVHPPAPVRDDAGDHHRLSAGDPARRGRRLHLCPLADAGPHLRPAHGGAQRHAPRRAGAALHPLVRPRAALQGGDGRLAGLLRRLLQHLHRDPRGGSRPGQQRAHPGGESASHDPPRAAALGPHLDLLEPAYQRRLRPDRRRGRRIPGLTRGHGLRHLLRGVDVQRHRRDGRAARPDGGRHRHRRRPQAPGRPVLVLEGGSEMRRRARELREEVMHIVLRRIVAVVVLLAVLVSGAPPASWAAEKVTVGVGGVALMVYLPTALAKAKGYFAEEGLDVEVLDIKGGGSQAASALIGGSVDFSANAIDHAIKAKAQGKDLVAVHSHVRLAPMGLVVANKYKGEIKSLADLKGRPVGVTSPGSQTHMVLGFLLAKSGVKADEVKIIGAGGNTMPLAIEKDSVHAGMMVDPFFTVFLKQGKGYALVDMFTTKGTLDAMG